MEKKLYPDFDDHITFNPHLISHYTDAKAGIEKILDSGQIKLSWKKRTDDPIENKDFEFHGIIENPEDGPLLESFKSRVSEMIRDARILCFCKNRELRGMDEMFSFHKGYIRPRMWSQYGDRHKGVCLVFNKVLLAKKIIQRNYPQYYIFKKDIDYTNRVSYQRSIHELEKQDYSSRPGDFIRVNRKVYFFSKLRDYRDESEYRIVLIKKSRAQGEDVLVDFEESLVGIICGERLHSAYFPTIKALAERRKVPAYQMIWEYGIPYFKVI